MTPFELYERMCQDEEEADELYEMARIGSRTHGIPEVIIWIGDANKPHGLRIRVSNLRSKWGIDDNFMIMMPSLEYDPKKVSPWINMPAVSSWIKLNQEVLHRYETGELEDTGEFLDQLSPIVP